MMSEKTLETLETILSVLNLLSTVSLTYFNMCECLIYFKSRVSTPLVLRNSLLFRRIGLIRPRSSGCRSFSFRGRGISLLSSVSSFDCEAKIVLQLHILLLERRILVLQQSFFATHLFEVDAILLKSPLGLFPRLLLGVSSKIRADFLQSLFVHLASESFLKS